MATKTKKNPSIEVEFDLADVPQDQLQAALARLEAVKKQREVEHKLATYQPYPKQAEFHAAGATHRERLLMSGNRFGKTECGAAEMAYHLTGAYPSWWRGRVFDKPVRAWAAGVTGETTRDVLQAKLIGPPFRDSEWGTGMIPKSAIGSVAMARGLPAAIDTVSVKHVSGGYSSLQFKSYERGREKWQGAALEVVHFDEEPDADIFSEGLTRTNETGGIVFVTFTPLKGISEVVRRFLHEPNADRSVTTATIDDAPHFSEEDKARISASYAQHEKEARIKGVPVLGSGRIFPVAEEMLAIDHREFPGHWPRIIGVDFGWDHPFAAVELVWDRDTDTVYVSKTYRVRESTPVIHAAVLRAWGKIPIAWPRDGRRETLEGAGRPLALQYRKEGLQMLEDHAQWEDKSISVEAGLQLMLTMMESGRFRVFKSHLDWWSEWRLYHRRDGRVHKEGDDLMSATRYAVMMLRFAKTAAAYDRFSRDLHYANAGVA